MTTLSLDIAEYEALASLARKGAQYDGLLELAKKDKRCYDLVNQAEAGAALDTGQTRSIEAFLKNIEKQNGITRYFLAVRWQEIGIQLRAGSRFPEKWPPEYTAVIQQFSRAISKADVDALVEARATNPQMVMVTLDPGLRVGWTLLNDYFES